MEKLPESAGKLIGALELLGSLGLVAGVTGYFLGFPWAIWFAIAAAVGLAVTMVGAISVHAVRRETKASIKMTAPLLLASTLSAVGWVLFISL